MSNDEQGNIHKEHQCSLGKVSCLKIMETMKSGLGFLKQGSSRLAKSWIYNSIPPRVYCKLKLQVSCLRKEHKGCGQDLNAGPLAPDTGPLTSKKNKIIVTL